MPSGTKLFAAQQATITQAGWNDGFGNSVTMKLADGSSVLFGHMQSVGVSVGQSVSPGTLVGLSDSTGNSTGPHLHFEVDQSGKPVDPTAWLEGGAATAASVSSSGGPFSLPSSFLSAGDWLTTPSNWWKVGFVSIGIAMVAFGVFLYFFKEEEALGSTAARTITKEAL